MDSGGYSLPCPCISMASLFLAKRSFVRRYGGSECHTQLPVYACGEPLEILKIERESSLLIARRRLLFLTMNVSLSPHFCVFLDSLELAFSSPILCGATRFPSIKMPPL
ncbi:hypothetical protein VNO77_39427 [Canavalia gladiata]|uniref:Uncharacterized protein n=1 Tax=Canavalia gladiata TaxID=3824 RepID=A0AAN9KEC2_CANGL